MDLSGIIEETINSQWLKLGAWIVGEYIAKAYLIHQFPKRERKKTFYKVALYPPIGADVICLGLYALFQSKDKW